ncbi:hypothetical protein A2U01_0005458 [Trifolium medium]|uniref:Uncharacterized protein n=1 Tax=Trifolium medium TaxID=97028 RepID=A0A392MB15_9FABA|nr:hypothetical protein [Trifolium medium]
MRHHLSHFPHSVRYMILLSLQYLELRFEDSICTFSENKLRNCIQQGNGSDEREWRRRGFAMLDDDDDDDDAAQTQTQKLAPLVAAAGPILIRLLLAAHLSQ